MEYNIVIEGSVGVGKSTLGRFLSEYTKIPLYEELVNNDTTILLDKFYADQKRWSFALQIHFLNERFKMIKNINKSSTGILDRSIYGDNIFAQLLNEDGNMTNEEYNTYHTLLYNMLEHVQPPHLLVYLKSSTDVAVKRLNERNRGIESTVPFGYWDRLNNKYDSWYDNYNFSEKMCIEVDNFDVYNDSQREAVLNLIISKAKEIKM
jgi:deoxyadenosine/deoxycytidine kinase